MIVGDGETTTKSLHQRLLYDLSLGNRVRGWGGLWWNGRVASQLLNSFKRTLAPKCEEEHA